MKHLRLFAGFAFAAVALFGSGCSDSDDLEPVMHAEAVQLDKTTLSLEIGSTEQLVATVLPKRRTTKRSSGRHPTPKLRR